MKSIFIKCVPLSIFIILVIFFWKGLSLNPRELPSVKLGQSLPKFSLPRLNAEKKEFSNKDLPHKPFLLNFWASWCVACTQEQPFLQSLANQGEVIYGINYKDNVDSAKQWLNTWGNPFVQVGQDIEGRLAIDMGVYGAPETFLIDGKERIIFRHAGILTPKIWKKEFLPRISLLTGSGQ